MFNFSAHIAICLCWLNEALHECFFEFRFVQSGLVTSCRNKIQDKTGITWSNSLWRKMAHVSQSRKNLWKALKTLKSAWGTFSGSGGAASLPLPFPFMKLYGNGTDWVSCQNGSMVPQSIYHFQTAHVCTGILYMCVQKLLKPMTSWHHLWHPLDQGRESSSWLETRKGFVASNIF